MDDPTGAAAADAPPPPSRRTKLAYAGTEWATGGLYILVNTWLLYFLVNAVGLRPLQAGAAFLLGRVLDALLDPLMGELCDRRAARFPRLRWVRIGALPLAVSFVALWWLPLLGGPPFLLAVLSFMLFSAAYTVVAMPYLSLTPLLAPDYDARTSLTGYRMAMATLAGLVAVAAPPILIALTTGESELAAAPASGWLTVAVTFAVLAMLGLLGLLRGVHEPAGPTGGADGAVPVLAPLRPRDVLSALRVGPVRVVIAVMMITSVGLMLGNSLLPFFLESALGLDAGQQTAALGGAFALSIAATPLWVRLSGRLGKGGALRLGIVVHVAGLLLLAGLRPGPDQLWLLAAVLLPTAIGMSAIIVLPWAVTPDAVEFDALAAGRRRDGLVYALTTLGQKIASSAGVFGSSLVAAVFGYEAGQAAQSADTVAGLSFAVGPVATVVYLLALLAVRRLPARSDHAVVSATLAAQASPAAPTVPPTGPDGVAG